MQNFFEIMDLVVMSPFLTITSSEYLPSVTHEVLFICFISSSNSEVDSNPEGHHHSQCEDHIVHNVESLLSSGFKIHDYIFLMVNLFKVLVVI